MKERLISAGILLLAALTLCLIVIDLPRKNYAEPASDFSEAVRNGETVSTTATPKVAEEVIRLHILADSDSERDQSLKLALRDILLPYINAATLDAENKADAMEQLTAQCGTLTKIANVFLAEQNTGYTATVSVERIYFPIRIYGSDAYLSPDAVIFPPGYYDSVQVVLGSGEGHNWWCLAYPSLCFIDASYDYVPKDSEVYKLKIGTVKKEALEQLFYGRSDGNRLLWDTGSTFAKSDEITLYFGCKLWELWKHWWNSIQ